MVQKYWQIPRKYPTQLTQNSGGPKIYTGGREEGHMNKTINIANELARKSLPNIPVTHFGSPMRLIRFAQQS